MASRTDQRLERFQTEFLPRLIESFRPTLVVAFGSRARGEGLRHSDLDLLIVSEAFSNVRWLDRPVRVQNALDLNFGVDLLCYTPKEYERKRQELGIVRTATEEGVVLLKV
jgi:hypothetical protein